MPAQRVPDLVRSQRAHLFLDIGVPLERPAEIELVREHAREGLVVRALHLPALKPAGFRLGDLLLRESTLERTRDLLPQGLLQLLRVLRRVDREYGEAARGVERADRQLRADAVAQAFLLADADREPRVEEAAAEHVIAEDKGGIVGILVGGREVHASEKEGVRLVGRLELLGSGRYVLERTRDPRERLRRRPSVEEPAQELGRLLRVEVSDHRQLAMRGAEKFGVELLRVRDRSRLVLGDGLVQRGLVARVLPRIRRQPPAEGAARHDLRLAALLLEGGEVFLTELLELVGREHGLTQGLGEEFERAGQVLAHGLDAGADRAELIGEIDPRLQLVQVVRELLAGVERGAAHQHVDGQVARRPLAAQARLVADVERERRHHGAAAGLLRQERELQAAGQRRPLRARLHVRGRRIEDLAGRDRLFSGVALKKRGRLGRRGHLGPVRLRGREEFAERPVRDLEIPERDALDVLGRHLADAVAVQEEEPPVALGDPFGDLKPDDLGLVERELEVFQRFRARALQLFLRNGRCRERIDRVEERLFRVLERLLLAHFGAQEQQAWLFQVEIEPENGGGLLRLDERLVQAAGGRVAEHVREQVQPGSIGVASGRNVVRGRDEPGRRRRGAASRCARRPARVERVRRREQSAPGFGIGPNELATSASAFASSNLPATIRTALSGW